MRLTNACGCASSNSGEDVCRQVIHTKYIHWLLWQLDFNIMRKKHQINMLKQEKKR